MDIHNFMLFCHTWHICTYPTDIKGTGFFCCLCAIVVVNGDDDDDSDDGGEERGTLDARREVVGAATC